MEKWVEIYKGVIPPGRYTTEARCGEKEGVVIFLESKENSVKLDFGALSAIRILDEGVVLQEIFNKSEFERYDENEFSNTIYKLDEGDFGKFIKKLSGETVYDFLEYGHYLIITLNYYIEVVSRWEPDIEVISLVKWNM